MVLVIIIDGEKDTRKARHGFPSILTVTRWKIGTSIEWATIRGEEDGHGPATLLGESLHCLHIDVVYIWALLAVYFDGDKMLVHEACNVFVLEGFALHDVAPVAGGVANAEQNWFVFLLGFLQGFFAPWVPIYGVVGVLQQVRACLVDEPGGVFMLRRLICGFGHGSFGWGLYIFVSDFFLLVVLMGVLYHICDSLTVSKLI